MTHSSHIPKASTLQIMKLQTENDDLMLAHRVRKGGYPNRYGARIPVHSNWNLPRLQQLLGDYEDADIVEWLRHGWPSGRLPSLPPPTNTFKNHKGATDYPQALDKYISKEKEKGAVIGPFTVIPFQHNVGISPISTRPKKSTDERRVIIDLSFPPGDAVNDGMIRDNYLGLTAKLTFPTVDDLALRVYILGRGTMMFKIDLSRYFRQLPLDPGDYSLIGYIIGDNLYFDKVLPMGMRTAPYIAQRVTNAIRHIHQKLGYFLLNYIDDFLGAEERSKVWEVFNHLTHLLDELGVETAPGKVVPPTTRLEFLGITYDSQTMTMEIPKEKIKETPQELHTWTYRTMTTGKEMESLVGKLQFMGKCVKPGRIFISRLINWMKTLDRQRKYTIPLKARKDMAWWARYLEEYNGVSILWLHNNTEPDQLIATDASKKGYGGISGQQYFKGRFPLDWHSKNIAELEMWAVLVALKIWAPKLRGQYFRIQVDNEAVATVINSGAARNPALQDGLREIAMLAARHEFIIKAEHITGISNRIPDWLSRWHEVESRKLFRQFAKEKSLHKCTISHKYLQYDNQW